MTAMPPVALRPLLSLLEQVEHDRDLALAHQQRAHHQLLGAQQQAAQLILYRNDYAQRYAPQLHKASTPEILRHYHGFMLRLQQAIDQQSEAVQRSELGMQDSMAAVLRHEQRLNAVRKLIERRTHEMERHAARQEQRSNDELASRRGGHRARHNHFANTRI